MLRCIGTVAATGAGWVEVDIRAGRSACHGCSGGCGLQYLSRAFGRESSRRRFVAPPGSEWPLDSRVQIEFPARQLLVAACLAYGLPLLGLGLGLLLGLSAWPQSGDLASGAGLLTGLAGGMFMARVLARPPAPRLRRLADR